MNEARRAVDYDPIEGRSDPRVAVSRHTVSLMHVDFVQTHFASYFTWVEEVPVLTFHRAE